MAGVPLVCASEPSGDSLPFCFFALDLVGLGLTDLDSDLLFRLADFGGSGVLERRCGDLSSSSSDGDGLLLGSALRCEELLLSPGCSYLS